MNILTNEKIQEAIQERNKVWEKATKREKAVLVAQDVLDRLRSKQITAEAGTWLEFDVTSGYAEVEVPLQECVLGGEPCACCAQGALMMGLIGWRNKVKSSDLSGWSLNNGDSKFDLKDIFDKAQQRLIELTFENGYGQYCFGWDNDDLDDLDTLEEMMEALKDKNTKNDNLNLRAKAFHYSAKNEKDLMKKIMQNIIENKGVFIP